MNANEKPRVIQLVAVMGAATDEQVRRLIPTWQPGSYVAAYDPEVGYPSLVCTPDKRHALRLRPREAWDLWQSVPSGEPVRPDGKPNKPLTAFTVMIDTVSHVELARWGYQPTHRH